MYRSTYSSPRHSLEASGQLHAPVDLPSRKSPGTHWIGGRVGPRTDLHDVKRKLLTLPGLKFLLLCRPARSQSLYRLSYPGSTRCCRYLNLIAMDGGDSSSSSSSNVFIGDSATECILTNLPVRITD
jgi:hypothetical protein